LDETNYGWDKTLFFFPISKVGIYTGLKWSHLGRVSGASPVQMNGCARLITLPRRRTTMEGHQLMSHLSCTEYSRITAWGTQRKLKSEDLTFIETQYFSLFLKEENDHYSCCSEVI
jgi:hypothetical protein